MRIKVALNGISLAAIPATLIILAFSSQHVDGSRRSLFKCSHGVHSVVIIIIVKVGGGSMVTAVMHIMVSMRMAMVNGRCVAVHVLKQLKSMPVL